MFCHLVDTHRDAAAGRHAATSGRQLRRGRRRRRHGIVTRRRQDRNVSRTSGIVAGVAALLSRIGLRARALVRSITGLIDAVLHRDARDGRDVGDAGDARMRLLCFLKQHQLT